MSILLIFPVVIIILIYIQGFFAGSEMSMVSSNRIRFQYLSRHGNKRAAIINGLLKQPHRLFGTTLLSINMATVSASIMAHYFFERVIDYEVIPLEVLVVIVMEPLVLIFGELFPMSLARKYPNTTALRNAYVIRLAYIILFPLMMIPGSFSRLLGLLLRSSKDGKITRKDLQVLVTGRFSSITNKTQEYVKEVLSINEFCARDVMVHINEVRAVDENATVSEIKEIINETGHSRIPLFKENIFNIVATVHAASILGLDDKEQVLPHSDKLYIVPSTKPITLILKELKKNRKYMGIVVDEYGAVSGIITLEDIIEEIIGEINDEFDTPVYKNKMIDEDIFDASIRLDDFFDKTGIDLTEEDVDTLNGAINLSAGRIARKGEVVKLKNYQFKILEATDRLIKRVRLLK